MKKNILFIISIISIITLIASCRELEDTGYINVEETQAFKINLSINRNDVFTKATVKTEWCNGDVVFLFFKGVAAPKYLELKYSDGNWTATSKNGLSSTDLSTSVDKKMTAIYLPYGNDATITASGNDFVFEGLTYSGYYLQAEQASYTFSNELKGAINLYAPTLIGDDKLIHFDITGYNEEHTYLLSQEFVKPLLLAGVSAEGIVSYSEGTMGDYITGFLDRNNSIISFSGVLDEGAVGSPHEYQFTVDDRTSCTLFTRNAGEKTLIEAKYIGIGDISNSEIWNSNEYVELYTGSGYLKWAKCNLGASVPEGYGDYYGWGEKEVKEDYSWENYEFGTGTTLTKYCWSSYNGIIDNKSSLDPEDDIVNIKMKGNWRMPTLNELNGIKNSDNFYWQWTNINAVNGFLVTSRRLNDSGKSIFFPAGGYREGVSLNSDNAVGCYWCSQLYSCIQGYNLSLKESTIQEYGGLRYYGMSIRPVAK